MKILIIGSGGREHAIGKKIKNQNPLSKLFFAPGNGGTQQIGENISFSQPNELLEFAQKENIQLTIVGPEQLLAEGIVDLFQEYDLPIFGPPKNAALLESSKAFAKEFMQKYEVNTASYKVFKHFVDAKAYLSQVEYPTVIKASGLATGKGVVICQDEIEAEDCLRAMMLEEKFGDAGKEVVIEEFLEGFEASIISIFNGKEIRCMLSAKDHKKIGENDTGLNTGGMGVVVPNPQFTEAHFQDFKEHILNPTLAGLLNENLLFSGVIFFGLMITEKGVKLLEYNLRFGDPETQTLLPLLKNNFLSIVEDSLKGKTIEFDWESKYSICVVMSSGGYPLEYEKGFPIHGLSQLSPNDYDIAGAQYTEGEYITSGGRVLNILAQENTLEKARTQVYENVDKVRFDYNYYRKDI